MNKQLMGLGIVALLLGGVVNVNATLMDYSYYSETDEFVGYLSINDDNFIVGARAYSNTLIEDLYFSWNSFEATLSDVDPLGTTNIGYDGTNSWITGGGGNLTGEGLDFGVLGTSLIAGTSYMYINPDSISRGYWVTTEHATGSPVPEPATMLLFGTGFLGLAGARLRKKKK